MKLGIIVPYRERESHLKKFLDGIKSYFKNQKLKYEVIIVEQLDDKPFNRGKLLNIGYIKAKALGCEYIVFHDVDMIPIEVDYSYSELPMHLATNFELEYDKSKNLTFDDYFGGVTMFTADTFEKINGYSNLYWGWGFEDDDLLLRCREVGLELDTESYRNVIWDRKALYFNGKSSYVKIPTKFNSARPFTLVSTFYMDKVNCNPEDISDEFSAFGIPGHDLNVVYTSFNRFKFEFFLKDNTPVDITSEYTPNIPVQVVATVNPRNKRAVFYINGKEVGTKYWDSKRIREYSKEPYMFLGVSDPTRKEKQKFFNGYISNFGILNKELSKQEVKKIFLTNSNESLFNQCIEIKDNWNCYYDSNTFNLEELTLKNEVNGSTVNVVNCSIKDIRTNSVTKVKFPFRRPGKYRLKKHTEAGYTDGFWKDWSSRENQLKYYRAFYSSTGYEDDGLSTCKYRATKTLRNDKNFNIIQIDAIT